MILVESISFFVEPSLIGTLGTFVWRMLSTFGDIISILGDIISTVGILSLWRVFSTVGDIISIVGYRLCGGCSILCGISTVLWEI